MIELSPDRGGSEKVPKTKEEKEEFLNNVKEAKNLVKKIHEDKKDRDKKKFE